MERKRRNYTGTDILRTNYTASCNFCPMTVCIDVKDASGDFIGRDQYTYTQNKLHTTLPDKKFVPVPVDDCPLLPGHLAERAENERIAHEKREKEVYKNRHAKLGNGAE